MGSRCRQLWAAVLCMAAACSSTQPEPPRSCKPEAPVDVIFEAVPDGAGRIALSVRAEPTAAVESVEVSLIAPDGSRLRGAPGALALAHIVTHDGRPALVAGIATVVVDGITMSKTIERPVGPPPVRRTRTYALPDGELAREVRP